MKEAKISEVKDQLSRYLRLVRRGEVIRILDRNVPIAQITPIARAQPGADADGLADMERKGLIRRAHGTLSREVLDRDPPGRPCGVLQALLAERETR